MNGVFLPAGTAQRVKRMLALLRLNQAELAKAIKMSQTWVSKVLLGKTVRDVEALARFVQQIRIEAEDRITRGLVSEDDLPQIRQVLHLMQGVLKPRALLAPPGGAIPSEANNFIRRSAIDEAIGWLERIPFTMCVAGPPDAGKTTVLSALAGKARTQGMKVSFVDCKSALKSALADLSSQGFSGDHPARESILATGIVRAAYAGWGLPEPDSAVIGLPGVASELCTALRIPSALAECTHQQRDPLARNLLVLDGITDLAHDHAAYAADILRMIRYLHNARATDGLDLSLAVSFSWISEWFYSHVQESSALVIFHPVIDLGWFSRHEVSELLDRLTGSSEHLEALYRQYGGAPLITHIAAARIAEHDVNPEDVFSEAVDGRGQFALPVCEVRRLLREASEGARGVLHALLDGEELAPKPYCKHRAYLVCAHLVSEDTSGQLSIPSELYRELITRVFAEEGL